MNFVLILPICPCNIPLGMFISWKYEISFSTKEKVNLIWYFKTFTQKRKLIQASNWILPKFFIFVLISFPLNFAPLKSLMHMQEKSWAKKL